MWKRIIGSLLGVIVVAWCSTGVSSAYAEKEWSLEEKQFWIELQKELDSFAKKVNDHCGSNITAAYAKASFRGKLTAGGTYGLDQYVRTVATSTLNAIFDICNETPMHKKAVAAKIKKVDISLGKTRYALDKGTFKATINTDDDQVSNYQRAMVAFLKKKL